LPRLARFVPRLGVSLASWRRRPEGQDGTWSCFRQAGHGYPPFWHPGSRRKPILQPPARWHGSGSYAQYLSLEPDGAWAEAIRYNGIRAEEHRAELRLNLWFCEVEERAIADLSSFARIAACGIDPRVFVDDDHAAAQSLASELREVGFRGLLTPSAALPGAINLTLFGTRHEVERFSLYGHRNPRPDAYVPVSLAAGATAPPAHLLRLTRMLGAPHLAYEDWLAASR
jgi:RES domain-containing protein